MDQKSLRELEKHCIQEEAPACQATCPLHVDARTLVSQVGQGKWSDAWKTLIKTIPFPGILARICEHPCEQGCLRKDLGGGIKISELEKICVKQPRPRIRTLPMPKKNINVAVIGSEFSSLVTSLDLLRKGYNVTIFSKTGELGTKLRQLDENILPAKELEIELEALSKLGLQKKNEIPLAGELEKLAHDFQAVYIGQDDPECVALVQGTPDKKTFALPAEGFFAGGASDSYLQQAFEGRAAALSIERFAQKVSMTEGRQNEGPYPTRLYTDTSDIEPSTPVEAADKTQGYTQEEAKQEAKRCINCHCLECLKVCPYLEHFKGYPRQYARKIYNNAAIVHGGGHHSANIMLNSCSLCGLCTEICPTDFSMAELCVDARQDLVEREMMPKSAHEFSLLDMEFSNSENFMLCRHAAGQSSSKFAFFPGCQLSGADPDKIKTVYSFLQKQWAADTGLILQCCGAPAHWSGYAPEARQAFELLTQNWQQLGQPKLVVACSSCLDMLEKHLPQIPKISLWEVLDQCELPAVSTQASATMAIHDPCTTRHAPQVQDAARSLAQKAGLQLQELEFGRDKTECCGFGGLVQNANPDMAKTQLERRAGQSEQDYLSYCAMCRENLRGTGKRTAHLLDFLFADEKRPDPADRVKTGFSDSQENRARLRQELLAEIWQEKSTPSQKLELHITEDVAARLEERMILRDDIRQTIIHCEKTGQKLQSNKTGHFLGCYRPRLVMFWVEYSPAENGYHVHNSYCHRMTVKEGK